jgi:hypothetical protein
MGARVKAHRHRHLLCTRGNARLGLTTPTEGGAWNRLAPTSISCTWEASAAQAPKALPPASVSALNDGEPPPRRRFPAHEDQVPAANDGGGRPRRENPAESNTFFFRTTPTTLTTFDYNFPVYAAQPTLRF